MPSKQQQLDELLDHVYGPFNDWTFLKVKFLPVGRVPDLYQFTLKRGKKVLG